MHPLVNIAIRAARNASKPIVRALDHLDSLSVNEKDRHDVVTEIDNVAEQAIIQVIREAYPEHGIIAEESGEEQQSAETVWIIDPLDGTTNFIHGFPQFAISIAIKHRNKLQHGVIYDPLRQELFVASRGEGARLNDRRIRVSARKSLDDALLGTGFPFRQPQHLKPYLRTFEVLLPPTAGIRRAGSAALDLAYVAAGRLDGFWEFSLKPWDIAAGVVLVKEAGGLVADFQGEENYLDNGNTVAGNPKVLKAMLQVIQPSLKE